MNQKRFLTILPLVFALLVVIGILLVNGGQSSENTSFDSLFDCTEEFEDTGMKIAFEYGCEWTPSLETTLTDNFVYNENNTFGYVAERYIITMQDKSNEALVTMRVVLAETKGSIISLENKYDYEVIDNTLVRFKNADENGYRYGTYVSCSDIPENQLAGVVTGDDCTYSLVHGVSDVFPVQVTALESSNTKELDAFLLQTLKTKL